MSVFTADKTLSNINGLASDYKGITDKIIVSSTGFSSVFKVSAVTILSSYELQEIQPSTPRPSVGQIYPRNFR